MQSMEIEKDLGMLFHFKHACFLWMSSQCGLMMMS